MFREWDNIGRLIRVHRRRVACDSPGLKRPTLACQGFTTLRLLRPGRTGLMGERLDRNCMIATELARKRATVTHTLHPPAKVNLTLEVLGRRSDGFHDIRSIVMGVALTDRITCTLSHACAHEFRCSDPELENDRNLAWRAAACFMRETGHAPSLSIHLEKRIPVAAGLGGGSSDAAAVLMACNALLQTGWDESELAHLGAALGSDVPLFFSLPSALIEGRGEVVRAESLKWSGRVLLVQTPEAVSTEEVYRAWRPEDGAEQGSGPDAVTNAGSSAELMSLCFNALEPAVFRVAPAVARAKGNVEELTRSRFGLSGAGSTFFHLYDDGQAADEAQRRIEAGDPHLRSWIVAAPVAIESSPGKE